MGTFIIKRVKDNYHFTLESPSGEVICRGETRTNKFAAVQGVEETRSNFEQDDSYELKKASNGKTFFTLKNEAGKEIARSKLYSKESSARYGIIAMKKNIPDAKIFDWTTPGQTNLIKSTKRED